MSCFYTVLLLYAHLCCVFNKIIIIVTINMTRQDDNHLIDIHHNWPKYCRQVTCRHFVPIFQFRNSNTLKHITKQFSVQAPKSVRSKEHLIQSIQFNSEKNDKHTTMQLFSCLQAEMPLLLLQILPHVLLY